jgi:Arc/MetJ-type ribon-helix-helix transcriptional regulator
MSLALDPATEQRIQREIARGAYREPAELINRALDLLESQENWLLRNKDAIHERLAESMAQAERGELHPPDEVRALLHQDRQSRASRPPSTAAESCPKRRGAATDDHGSDFGSLYGKRGRLILGRTNGEQQSLVTIGTEHHQEQTHGPHTVADIPR